MCVGVGMDSAGAVYSDGTCRHMVFPDSWLLNDQGHWLDLVKASAVNCCSFLKDVFFSTKKVTVTWRFIPRKIPFNEFGSTSIDCGQAASTELRWWPSFILKMTGLGVCFLQEYRNVEHEIIVTCQLPAVLGQSTELNTSPTWRQAICVGSNFGNHQSTTTSLPFTQHTDHELRRVTMTGARVLMRFFVVDCMATRPTVSL